MRIACTFGLSSASLPLYSSPISSAIASGSISSSVESAPT
jgi:hypothetical protein